jgi:FtsP/CotA-like multicopper oxidase with cupredoxin domain
MLRQLRSKFAVYLKLKVLFSRPGNRTECTSLSSFLRPFSIVALMVAALFLANPFAVLNAQSVPGSVSEEVPQPQANEEMAAEGNAMSNSQINTQTPEQANQFAVETSEDNTTLEVTRTNVNQTNIQDNSGSSIDVPTGAAPSPLFNASPFNQQMLRFEEFGPVPLGPAGAVVPGTSFPAPASAGAMPNELALDTFLDQYIGPALALPAPFPTRLANDPDNGGTDENPWKPQIEAFLGRSLLTPPAEGRPPGEDWAHQRWGEFFPQVYYNTAQTGARPNTGLRDRLQFHQYSAGEFGSGPDGVSGTVDDGLYHNTTGAGSQFDGTTAGLQVQFHPNFPVQDPLALWTWDGTFPPKLLQVRYGEPVLMRHYNGLPIDPAANYGFGLHTLSTHEHNGHNPAESDGYTQAFFFPGQFYDYHWPMIIAGHDTFPSGGAATPSGGPRADAIPDIGNTALPGDPREIMSTHWFHDHMLDFTATNVYKGNAAMMNYYSSVDRGNEAVDDGINLRLPSGSALNWGNRDYDVNLVIAGKAWDADGQLFFNIFNLDGYLGDQMLTNWLWKPYLDVRARRYRFRLVNGSVSRYMRLALVEQVQGNSGEFRGPRGSNISYNRVPFHMIANDGNIMEHAVYFDGNKTVGGLTNRKGILPTQAIAERYDIIVDFAQFAPGTKLYLVNLLEHHNGRRPHQEIPLGQVLNGKYHDRRRASAELADQPVPVDGSYETDPTVTRFLEFRVQPYDGIDLSMNPAEYVEGGKTMIPLPEFTQAELDNAIHRSFDFARSSGTDTSPWTIKTDGGAGFNMDPRRISASPTSARAEIWHLEGHGGWSHPIHVHFEEGQIFKRDGVDPPEWEKWARKDVYRLGRMDDSGDSVDFVIRFREFLGTFMEHCHNTQHEDHAMLLRWDVESPGQVSIMPTPMPSWDGVGYVPTYALPTFRTGDLEATEDAANDPDFGNLVSAVEPPPPPSPPPPSGDEIISFDKASYSSIDLRWKVEGFSNEPESGSTITAYLGTGTTGPVIGSTIVSAVATPELEPGEWLIRVDDSTAFPGAETTISLQSSTGQEILGMPIEFVP